MDVGWDLPCLFYGEGEWEEDGKVFLVIGGFGGDHLSCCRFALVISL